MLVFLLSLASFLFLFSKSLGTRLASWFPKHLEAGRIILAIFFRRQPPCNMFWWKKMSIKRSEEMEGVVGEEEVMPILDLPELALDCILERLPPSGLCNMAGVCRALKERCRNDHLWERHLSEKWGRLLGNAAVREWKSFAASAAAAATTTTSKPPENEGRVAELLRALLSELPFPLLRWVHLWRSKPTRSFFNGDSAMSWYLALERGEFWLPAQVYNREHGHSGFMMSCYDADLRYDGGTDTFKARYPPHGRRAIVFEDAIPWERIRAAPTETSPHALHLSDCLDELHPGDHFEIQWRKNKEFPYGWWYGVVGHLETCDGSTLHCRCPESDTIVLEFNHYATGSRWRKATISRSDHRESGNESDGFYGGIRKLGSKLEISEWRRLWPLNNL